MHIYVYIYIYIASAPTPWRGDEKGTRGMPHTQQGAPGSKAAPGSAWKNIDQPEISPIVSERGKKCHLREGGNARLRRIQPTCHMPGERMRAMGHGTISIGPS